MKPATTVIRGSNKIFLMFTVVICAFYLSNQSAWAEESKAANKSPIEIEEIIITAQKREQTITEAAIAVQAFRGEDLERRALGDLETFVNEIPGASQNLNWGPAVSAVQLRGTGATGQLGSSSVGFYLDDVPFFLPRNQAAPPSNMFDLERVEVLRGPQGTLWGQGSMGGTIRYITANPDATGLDAKIQLNASDLKDGGTNSSVDAMVNIPLIEDVLAVRMSGGRQKFAGWFESPDFPGEEDINDGDMSNFRLKALWTPSAAVDISLLYWHIEIDQDFANFGASVEPPLITGTAGFRGFSAADTDLYATTLSWNFGNSELTSTTTYMEHLLPFGTGINALGGGHFVNRIDSDSFSQEVRLVSTGDDPLGWIVGVFYNDSSEVATGFLEWDVPFIQSIAGSMSTSTLDSESVAVFGELSYELLDGKLVPLVGLRYFTDDRQYTDQALLFAGTPNEALQPPFLADDTFKSWNPRFNLSYYPAEGALLYFNAAKGFRSGSFQTAIAAVLAAADGIETGQSIPEDTVWSYEVGGKFSLLDGALTVEGALYRAMFSDLQFLYTTSLGTTSLIVFGDSEVTGFETAIGWNTPIDGLRLSLVGHVLDSEWTDIDPVKAVATGISEGDEVGFTPKWSYNIAAQYDMQIAGFDGYSRVSYAGRASQLSFTGEESGEIGDLSLNLGVEIGNWEVSVYGKNLLDDRGPTLLATGLEFSYTPRSVGLMLRWHL